MNVRKARTAFVKFLVLIVLCSWLPGIYAQEQETDLSAIELIQLSRRYVAQNDLATALTYARRAIEVDPAFPGAWKQVGRILMLAAQYEDALTAFQTIIELKATDPQVESWILYTLERIIGQQDTFDLSEFLTSWMGDGLRDDAKLVVSSLREIFAGRLNSAEDLLNSLRAISGETVNLIAYAWYQLGEIHSSDRSYESAITAFNNAILYRNGWLPPIREMGWSYSAMGRPKDAADTWARGLTIMPDVNITYRSWLNWVVEARIQAEQYPEALVSIDQLLKVSPNDSDALYYKYLILLMQGRREDAAVTEKALQRLRDGSKLIQIARINVDRYNDRFLEAEKACLQLRRKYPRDEDVRTLLVNLYRSWIGSITTETALPHLRKLKQLEPDSLTVERDLGWSLYLNNQYDEAIKSWSRVMDGDFSEKDRLAYLVIAQLFEDSEDDRAQGILQRWMPGVTNLQLGQRLLDDNRNFPAYRTLRLAWEQADSLPRTGLLLAYTEGQAIGCDNTLTYLAPFIEDRLTTANEQEIDMFLTVLDRCAYANNMSDLIIQMEARFRKYPQYNSRILTILRRAAREADLSLNNETAMQLYRMILAQDPDDSITWRWAYQVLSLAEPEGLSRPAEGEQLLSDVLERADSKAVREGIQGQLAFNRGDLALAAEYYEKSLEADPEQVDMRINLFKLLVELKRFDEARKHTEWFSSIYEAQSGGDAELFRLADMYEKLQDQQAAMDFWERLYLIDTLNVSYAFQYARQLDMMCRTDEAILILDNLLQDDTSDVRESPLRLAVEQLAEMESARGNYARAYEILETNWDKIDHTVNTWRIRAEVAERVLKYEEAIEAAQARLALAESSNMRSIIARSYDQLEERQKAIDEFSKMVVSNPVYLPGMYRLRELYTRTKEIKTAVDYSERVVEQRP